MFSKWLPVEADILKLSVKFKIMKLNLFLKNMHTHTLLTTTIFAYNVNNHFKRVIEEQCSLVRYYWQKINIHYELEMSLIF